MTAVNLQAARKTAFFKFYPANLCLRDRNEIVLFCTNICISCSHRGTNSSAFQNMAGQLERYSTISNLGMAIELTKTSIYASPPFKFIIDGDSLYIHADLVSLYSKPLDRLMNGHLAEAQKGFAVLKDVDKETFVRFIQWAYNGYYDRPDFDITHDTSSSERSIEAEDATADPLPEVEPALDSVVVVEESYNNDWSFGHGSRRKAYKKEKKRAVWEDIEPTTEHSSKDALKESFIKLETIVRQDSIAIPPPRPNQDRHEDYTNIFLSHARLHVFADKYDIQSLKVLALEELQTTLAIFTLHRERTSDIIELLRYIYGNTGESVPGAQDLRTLMTHYVGFEMDILIKDQSFKDLMFDDGGALLGDFMSMVGQRI